MSSPTAVLVIAPVPLSSSTQKPPPCQNGQIGSEGYIVRVGRSQCPAAGYIVSGLDMDRVDNVVGVLCFRLEMNSSSYSGVMEIL